MSSPFTDFLHTNSAYVDRQLVTFAMDFMGDTSSENGHALEALAQACQYALGSGGKRVRPILAYASAHALDRHFQDGELDHITCALEMIHTYSLIHDDLPAMDDDDLRRGKPSLHRAYDEATAILVGDGLQARAFELLADAPGLSAEQKVRMIKVLAAAAGPCGMVGGSSSISRRLIRI